MSTALARTLAALAALALALALVLWQRDARKQTPSLHPAVALLRIEQPDTHWHDEGFVEMVPPVRLPSDRGGSDRIEVWLKVGDGKIGARRLDDGRMTLSFPPGTIADRVESMGAAVIDVRGTTLLEDGELFHVYVAEDLAPGPLLGWQWRRGDSDAEASSTAALLHQLDRTKRRLRGQSPPSAEQHATSLLSYQKNNACSGCHIHDKPPTAAGAAVHRPTDSAGFFVPLSVLADAIPLERHRPWDTNVGDPFLDVACAGGSAPRLVARGAARHFVCATAEIPLGRLDVARGIASNDRRTVAMCRSRRYLYEHMDDAARALFAEAFSVCGIGGA